MHVGEAETEAEVETEEHGVVVGHPGSVNDGVVTGCPQAGKQPP